MTSYVMNIYYIQINNKYQSTFKIKIIIFRHSFLTLKIANQLSKRNNIN